MKKTFAQQSAQIFFQTFFAFVKGIFIVLVLIVSVAVASQSTVAPVSMRLLGTYALEYAASTFKPYRGYFPRPYPAQIDIK